MVDEGDGAERIGRFTDLLTAAGDCTPVPILIPLGDGFDSDVLRDVDGMFVCGGLTPAYADSLVPAAAAITAWVTDGHPYAGFSAGAVIAAQRAIVGGWLRDGVPICSEETAEDLDELTVVAGLGLLPFSVDVHCAQWGTLSRAVAAVEAGAVPVAVGIDEDTMLSVKNGDATVSGVGHAWLVAPASEDTVAIQLLRNGTSFARPKGNQ
jgi:cyanophycinase